MKIELKCGCGATALFESNPNDTTHITTCSNEWLNRHKNCIIDVNTKGFSKGYITASQEINKLKIMANDLKARLDSELTAKSII